MSDTEKDLAVHIAVCDERYKNIADMLKEGDRRMTKIEYLIYAVMALVMFGPGCCGAVFPQVLWNLIMAKNWIQNAIKKPGALKKELGVPAGKTIPAKKLAAAAKKPGKEGQRARLAETLKGFKK